MVENKEFEEYLLKFEECLRDIGVIFDIRWRDGWLYETGLKLFNHQQQKIDDLKQENEKLRGCIEYYKEKVKELNNASKN